MKRKSLKRIIRRPVKEQPTDEGAYYYPPPSKLDFARLLLEALQFAAEVYDRWRDRQDRTDEEAEMTPAEAREYAAEIIAAAEKAEADNRDQGEEWNAP